MAGLWCTACECQLGRQVLLGERCLQIPCPQHCLESLAKPSLGWLCPQMGLPLPQHEFWVTSSVRWMLSRGDTDQPLVLTEVPALYPHPVCVTGSEGMRQELCHSHHLLLIVVGEGQRQRIVE